MAGYGGGGVGGAPTGEAAVEEARRLSGAGGAATDEPVETSAAPEFTVTPGQTQTPVPPGMFAQAVEETRGVRTLPPITVRGTPGGGGPAPLTGELAGRYGGRYFSPDFEDVVGQELGVPRDESGVVDWSQATPEQQERGTRALKVYSEWRRSYAGQRAQKTRLGIDVGEAEDEYRRREEIAKSRQAYQEANLSAKLADKEREERAASAARLRAFEGNVARQREQIAQADKRVAQYRIGDDRNAGQLILHALGAGLGALGAGMAKMPNFAMDAIESQLNRRLEEQKIEKGSLEQAAGRKRGDLDAYYEQFGNEEQARSALMARYYRETGAMAERVKAETANARAKNALDYISKQAPLRARDIEYGLAMQGAAEELTAKAAAAQAAAQRRQAQQLPGGLTRYSLSAKDAASYAERYVPEAGGFAQNAEDKKEIGKAFAFRNEADRIIDDMEAIIDQANGKFIPYTEAELLLEQKGNNLMFSLSKAEDQGVIREGEAEKWDKMVPKGTEALRSDAQTKKGLSSLRQMIRDRAESQVEGRGLTPGAMYTTPSAKGEPETQLFIATPPEEEVKAQLERARERAAGPKARK